MKKLTHAVITSILFALIFASCASNNRNVKDENGKIIHPRTYIIDPFDGAKEVMFKFNEHELNYQASIDMWKFLKYDKPQAGDTIILKGQFISNIDLHNVVLYLADTSPAANYWSILTTDNYLMDIKSYEKYGIELKTVLDVGTKGNLSIIMAYDGNNHGQEEIVKVGVPARFDFEKIEETTNTETEIGFIPSLEQQVYNIQIDKYAAFMEIATVYPVVNGIEDMSVVANYQTTPEITMAFGDNLPRAGDTINLSWTAVSDVDISQIYVRPIECPAGATSWRELINVDWDNLEKYRIVKNVKKDEPFQGTVSFVLNHDAVTQVKLCIWYDIGDSRPDGPAIIKKVKLNDYKK